MFLNTVLNGIIDSLFLRELPNTATPVVEAGHLPTIVLVENCRCFPDENC